MLYTAHDSVDQQFGLAIAEQTSISWAHSYDVVHSQSWRLNGVRWLQLLWAPRLLPLSRPAWTCSHSSSRIPRHGESVQRGHVWHSHKIVCSTF